MRNIRISGLSTLFLITLTFILIASNISNFWVHISAFASGGTTAWFVRTLQNKL